jgi:hypothetical protein
MFGTQLSLWEFNFLEKESALLNLIYEQASKVPGYE